MTIARAILADLAADPEALAELRRLVAEHDGSELLTAEEVAGLLKVSTKTVNAWARSGRLEAVRVGRAWRFTRKAVDALPLRAGIDHDGEPKQPRPRRRTERVRTETRGARVLREL